MQQPVLSCESVSLTREGVRLFANLQFEAHPGELVVIQGSNGAGKSTLLCALGGIYPVSTGEIRFGDTALAKHPDYPGFVYYQGHKNGLRLELTVEENLAFWARAYRVPELLDAALCYFDLEPYADMPVRSLSAGWQRRVALSRLILTQARLWLLDEPFANLDAEATKLLQSLMQVRLEQGGIICMATHAQPQGERVKFININCLIR